MKSTNIMQVPQRWPEIMKWIADGEEVELEAAGNVLAKLVPTPGSSANAPDFLARAREVWGAHPPGKPLSAVVAEGRGTKLGTEL